MGSGNFVTTVFVDPMESSLGIWEFCNDSFPRSYGKFPWGPRILTSIFYKIFSGDNVTVNKITKEDAKTSFHVCFSFFLSTVCCLRTHNSFAFNDIPRQTRVREKLGLSHEEGISHLGRPYISSTNGLNTNNTFYKIFPLLFFLLRCH